jgi:hypothetical protein
MFLTSLRKIIAISRKIPVKKNSINSSTFSILFNICLFTQFFKQFYKIFLIKYIIFPYILNKNIKLY